MQAGKGIDFGHIKMYELVCDLQAHLIAHFYIPPSQKCVSNKSIINIIFHDMHGT